MITRSRTDVAVFANPFLLKGVDHILPPGSYRIATDETLVEGLSFPVYRRVSTVIFVPASPPPSSSMEMLEIDPRDLEVALVQDRHATLGPSSLKGDAMPRRSL